MDIMDYPIKLIREIALLPKILNKRNKTIVDFFFYAFALYYYNGFPPPPEVIQIILNYWENYFRRNDIKLDQNNIPMMQVIALPSMNHAFRIPIYNKKDAYKNFVNPIIDHYFYINDEFELFSKDNNTTTHPDHKNIVEFMISENKATRSEIAFSILSHCQKNNIEIPRYTLKIIADGWCKYSQRSDLAKENRITPLKKIDVVPFATMNEAFDIPIYTDGKVRREFYSELVYTRLASLRAQGVPINNEAHDFVGYKYGFSGGTSKNYYSYLLAKGAPSLSGRLKITNTRTYLNIPFSPLPEDLAEFRSSKWKDELVKRKNQSWLSADQLNPLGPIE